MQIISDDSFELEELPSEPITEQVSRQSYRLPLKDKSDFAVIVNEQSYPLIDASISGVCFAIDNQAPFNEQEKVTGCSLVLKEQRFDNLQGEVVHKSLDDEGNWVCGLQWTNCDEVTDKSLQQALITLRKEMFENA